MTVQDLPVLADEETTVGNYFISNYPPFSFWSDENVSSALEAIGNPPAAGTDLGLYVHIPFCRKRCHFCYFKVYTGKSASDVRTYIDYLKRELTLYQDRPFLGDRKPNFIYFGGGTPSFLSANQLSLLAENLQSILPWDEAEEIAFECEPGTLSESKLQMLRQIGVTRLSLGIENFDDKILEQNNRAHRSAEIARAYDFARSIEFPQINIDLIAGMVGETEENWERCIRKTIDLQPDSITIYQMEIPYNTTIYQEMKENDTATAPVADWKTKRRWVDRGFAELEAAGYTIGSAYTAVKDVEKTRFVYRDELWRGADMLSLGVASFGHIGGVHMQNEKDNGPYYERIDEGQIPVRRAYALSDEERMIREFVLQLKLGSVRRDYFHEKHSVDIHERFASAIRELGEFGLVKRTEEGLTLTRSGLLRVDGLLPAFFQEKHRSDRYV